MIDELADRNALRELGDAAEMIAVPVGDDEVVDLGEVGVFAAAMIRSASRTEASGPKLPVSMRSDCPDGATKRVAFPPSTSTT